MEGSSINHPSALPQDRGYETQMWTFALALLSFLIGVSSVSGAVSSEGWEVLSSVVAASCCYFNLIGVVEVLRRTALFMEERHHVRSRYNGSWQLLIKNTVFVDQICVIMFALSIFWLLWLREDDLQHRLYNLGPVCWTCIIISVQLILRETKLDQSKVAMSIMLDTLQPLDYGSGMAYNFFYGYLRIVLPNTGDEGKGLLERIGDYIAVQRIEYDSFPVHKLFVLIPSSSYTPTNLSEVSSNWMQPANNLEKQVKNRAGVIDRVYKNSVYKIEDPDNPGDQSVYVVAEGATPLKTLYEVVQHSSSVSAQKFFKEHHNTIVFNFYKTLTGILKHDRDCKDLCELLYYEDTDEDGDNVNVSIMLLNRIKEIRRKELRRQQATRRQLPVAN